MDPLPPFFFIMIFLQSSQSISRLIFLDFSKENQTYCFVKPKLCGHYSISQNSLERSFEGLFFFSFSCKDSEVSAFLAELQLFLNKSPQDSCALPHILPLLSCQGLMPLLEQKIKQILYSLNTTLFPKY